MTSTMIVDDQDDVRLLIRVVIERADAGLSVRCSASSGWEALDRLEGCAPDIVVLDEMMPEMSGIETAERIRQRRPAQRMIMCSAYLDEDLRARALAAGIGECVHKDDLLRLPEALHRVAG